MPELTALQAIVLGLVQGLTEFIPISSTAHLRIVPALLGWADPGAAFSAVIQLGTLAAMLAYFAPDLLRLGLAALRSLGSAAARRDPDTRLAWSIAAGTVPVVVAGLALQDAIASEFRSLYVIATMLALLALALAGADWRAARMAAGGGSPSRTLAQLTLWPVVLIGCFQALALIPGTSRSGATILGGLLVGLGRADAARFSFLLGVPAILGSGLFELPVVLAGIERGELTASALLLGLLTAGVSGYAAIAFLLRYLERHTLLLFVVYRLGLAALVAGLAQSGAIR